MAEICVVIQIYSVNCGYGYGCGYGKKQGEHIAVLTLFWLLWLNRTVVIRSVAQ